jgi:hypothetical protein
MELSLCEALSEISSETFSELEGPERYPHLRYEWLSSFEETGCVGARKGWIPRHLRVTRGKELVAFAPAYIKLDSYGEFVFDHAWAEFSELRLQTPYYPKLIVAVPFTPATGPRVLFRKGLDHAERESVFDLLTGALPDLAEQLGLSSVHILFTQEAEARSLCARGWTERLGVQFQFHRGQLLSFQDFLATFRSKRRAAISRERKQLSERGVEIEVHSGASLEQGDANLAYRLYLTTVDKYFFGKRYLNQAFFQSVVRRMPDSLHFVIARDTEGAVLGGAFNLLGEDALYGRYWGAFSEVPFLHFNVCLYKGVEECLRMGLSRFEPGAGGAHKEGRGFCPTKTRSLHYLRNPTLAAAVDDFCRREAEVVDSHVAQSGG